MDIFGIFSLSSKIKLCCFCQILCRILTNEILQTADMTVGRITVFFSVYVYSRFLSQQFVHFLQNISPC